MHATHLTAPRRFSIRRHRGYRPCRDPRCSSVFPDMRMARFLVLSRALSTACVDLNSTSFTPTKAFPVITTQPASQTVVVGMPVTFSVVATGDSITYQWFKGAGAIAGATASSYTIVTVATGASSWTVTSNSALTTLTLLGGVTGFVDHQHHRQWLHCVVPRQPTGQRRPGWQDRHARGRRTAGATVSHCRRDRSVATEGPALRAATTSRRLRCRAASRRAA